MFVIPVRGLGFGVLGFRVWGSGFKLGVWGLGLGFEVWGLWFRVSSSQFCIRARVWGLRFGLGV